ncbi:hypothetical protein [Herbaspirillum sp. meg3]|jgi:hypothetical protein|uniref:hypothetical protein n=1 Tax=Herbaspirillum sp. meg3 TaxID=2025949 RepID=UPI0012FD0354|nr:hypothetical protein [Herbaspirillum sp. meg3]
MTASMPSVPIPCTPSAYLQDADNPDNLDDVAIDAVANCTAHPSRLYSSRISHV